VTAAGHRPTLALSIGCPCGVGPEVAVLAAVAAPARIVLVGDHRVILRAARLRGVAPARFVRVNDVAELSGARGAVGVLQPTPTLAASDSRPGLPTPVAGGAQLAWVDTACDLASRGEVDGMVTGPVSKDMVVRSGAPGSAGFAGHTEHLEARLGAREVVMAFWTKGLTTSLATTHLPLARVPRAVTPTSVARATYWLGWLLARLARGSRVPRIAICALNPHAGEAGLLGHDEGRAITPGIARARARLAQDGLAVELVGPVPAETAFRLAVGRRFDGVVAMYHDQATIPMKITGFGEAVNVSLGLPIVRTSVDHGTGYDIAGKGLADPRGMREAIALGARLAVIDATARTRAARAAPG
jgi:4-hydroxythreonine-4-phosphate dehydrogenase